MGQIRRTDVQDPFSLLQRRNYGNTFAKEDERFDFQTGRSAHILPERYALLRIPNSSSRVRKNGGESSAGEVDDRSGTGTANREALRHSMDIQEDITLP